MAQTQTERPERSERPERVMVRKALFPFLACLALAPAIAGALSGRGAAISAALGVLVVFANFAAQGLSLAWAAGVSITVVQVVTLAGFVVRLGIILGLLYLLDTFDWFSPLAFGLTVVPVLILLLVYEAKLVMGGLGGTLQIPADPAAIRAHENLIAKENA